MVLTKEPVGKHWAVIWNDESVAEELLYWRLFEVAFEHCDIFSEVGIGYRPQTIGEEGFINWISWHAWATMPKDPNQQESIRQTLFRSVPKGATINAMVFTRELEADAFKVEIEKRMVWKDLGGEPYWYN